MTISIIDVFKIIQIQHDQHTILRAKIQGTVDIAFLTEKSCQSIQLVPHLIAVQKIQNCNQCYAKPGNMYLWNQNLNQCSCCEKSGKPINQFSSTILKVSSHFQRTEHQIGDSSIVHNHVNLKSILPGIMICFIYCKYQASGKYGYCQEQKIQNFHHCSNFQACRNAVRRLQCINKADWNCRCQAKSKIIRKNIQPAQPDRTIIHQYRNHLQNRDTSNQNKRNLESPCLSGFQVFAQMNQNAHKKQNKKIDGRQNKKV